VCNEIDFDHLIKIDVHDVRLFKESYFCSLKLRKEEAANKSSEIEIIAEHIWENYNDLNVTTVGRGPDIDPIFPKDGLKKGRLLRLLKTLIVNSRYL
jgi:hypothetical protein